VRFNIFKKVSTKKNHFIIAGKYSSNEARKKWKNLRDRFIRIIASEKLSSGAASNGSKNQWRFYESLQFLRDTLLRKE